MEIVAFASFIVLVLAWMMAPSGEAAEVASTPVKMPATPLAVEARA